MSELADMLHRRSIHQALKSWRQSSQLGEHPLTQLRVVEQRRKALNYDASPIGYGMALRDVLRSALEQMRPHDGSPDPLDKRWRSFAILTERYIHQRSPDAIAEEMGIARSTYDHTQNAALEALAELLREQEEASRRLEDSTGEAGVQKPVPAPFLAPPRMAHALIGRDELIADIRRRLGAGGGRAALYGLPGVGKTALALHLASEPDMLHYFADGALWAGLGRSPNVLGLLGAWGMALGLSADDLSRLPRLDDRARTLRALIGRRRMLLIIDDAWRIEDAMAFLVGGPECAHLLTTRQPHIALDFAGDAAIHLPELDSASGSALLEMLAPSVGERHTDAAARLVEAVGGLPLALTLMGQYLRKESQAGQPRRLRAAIDRLHGTGARLQLEQPSTTADQQPSFAPGTPLSLLKVIALSIDALEPAARQALWALSIFPPKPNTFSETAALAISQADFETLDGLSDAGLLEFAAADRYALHPTIAEYAWLKLEESPEAKPGVQGRMAAFFAALLTEEPSAAGARDTAFDLETDNIAAALEAAFSLQDWPTLVDGANAFYGFLETRGLYALAQPHLQRAEEATRRLAYPAGRIATLNNLGRIAQRYGDYQGAERLMQAGLDLARSLPDHDLISELLQGLGVVAVNRGEYQKAEGYFQEGLSLAQTTGQPARISALLANLGTLRFSRGDYAGAEQHFLDGLSIARGADLPVRICALLTNLGVLAARRGQYEIAEGYFRESLSLAQALGHRENVIFLLTNLGTLASERGYFAEAEAALHDALTIARQIGQRARISHLLANLGMLATHDGNYSQAEQYLQEGLALAREMGHRESMILHLINLGALEIARGKLPHAEAYLGEALDSARTIGHRQYFSACLNSWGELHLRRGASEQGEAAFQEALDIARSIGVEVFAATALFGLARAAAQSDLSEAAARLQESREIFRRIGHYRVQEVEAWAKENLPPHSSDTPSDWETDRHV